jgi:hypothetical protein
MKTPRYGLVLTNGVTVKDFNDYYQLTTAEATPVGPVHMRFGCVW